MSSPCFTKARATAAAVEVSKTNLDQPTPS